MKLGTDKDRIPCFVTEISHHFTFVFWAAIDLTRKKLPNVNQFFKSLYMGCLFRKYGKAFTAFTARMHLAQEAQGCYGRIGIQ